MHDAQEALRIAERAEGLYLRAIRCAQDNNNAEDARLKAQSDVKLIGAILGKDEEDIRKELYGD
jgi:hypothetical protein